MAVNKLLDRMREAVETSGTPGRVGNTPTNERCPPMNEGKKGTPPKFDMVHLKIKAWKFGGFRTWKPSFSGSMMFHV